MLTAQRYYDGTEGPYRALCPERSGHMNMGYWPAGSLREAQARLVQETALHCRERCPGLQSMVDAGSGWGGSARIFAGAFANLAYTGVNLSATQIEAARTANRDLEGVRYVQQDITAFAETMAPVDAFVSIEAAFHFERKERLLEALRPKVR